MTDSQRRALEILRNGRQGASQFAQKMWPESQAKNAQGLGLAGGGFLGKLAKQTGWVEPRYDRLQWWAWEITEKGLQALRFMEDCEQSEEDKERWSL